MSKLGDAFKDGRIVGATIAGAIIIAGATVGTVALTSANAEQAPAAVVETVEPVDFASLPYTNGLAAEQETDAAAAVAAEQARIAAEAAAAEAARVAAEQAAAAEAERVAAEQSADVEAETPSSEPEAPTDYCPDGYIDDPNLGCHSPICAVLEDGTQVPCAT